MFFRIIFIKNVFLAGWIITEDGDEHLRQSTTMRERVQGRQEKRWWKQMGEICFSFLNLIFG